MCPVIIYIWRHGKAEKDSLTGKDDDRALAPEGRNEVIDVADYCFVVKGLEKPEKIFSSPFLRARETAEMIQGFLACEKGLEFLPALKCGAAFPAMASTLSAKAKDMKCFAVVGHVPDLESLIHALMGGGPAAPVHLKTGRISQI